MNNEDRNWCHLFSSACNSCPSQMICFMSKTFKEQAEFSRKYQNKNIAINKKEKEKENDN